MLMYGTKYQKIIDKKLHVYRLRDIDENNVALLQDLETKEKIKETEESIKNNYVALTPDAFLIIMNTKKRDQMGELKDLYVCVNKASKIEKDNKAPDLIMRQNIYSKSKNSFGNISNVCVGECLNAYTCNNITELMDYEDILESIMIVTYVDDTLSTIFNCIPANKRSQFDNWLKTIKDEASKIKGIHVSGYCNNVKTFMEDNSFIQNYRMIFNILQVDFVIDLGDCSRDNEGNIILIKRNKRKLEDILREHIDNIRIIKYDKDIDVSKIVSYKHIMLSDKTGTIYLVAYEKISDYEIDNDIKRAFHVV